MRLEQLSLSPGTLAALREADESVESLLSRPSDRPHPSLAPAVVQEALHAIHTLATRASPLPVALSPVFTGSAVFDAHVALSSRSVIQLCGRSLAGKTLICVSLVAAALRHAHHVVWIDTCAGRWQVQTAVARLACPARLTVISVCSVSQALREIARLSSQYHPLSTVPKPRLLVFDSPAALLAPILGLKGSAGWSGHAAMQHLTASINQFVTLSSATVLLTNRVVDNATRPALGNIWSAFVDEQLLLKRVETHEERLEICITKSSKRAATCSFSVLITDNGITDNDVEHTQYTQQAAPS
ncbi:P-loop containing nucleoside triphosphate hydrolase [Gracilaria domingensis]|nr:P-loop containing nucleoside triphosphate hydrolase [Gracilaria domingensis]